MVAKRPLSHLFRFFRSFVCTNPRSLVAWSVHCSAHSLARSLARSFARLPVLDPGSGVTYGFGFQFPGSFSENVLRRSPHEGGSNGGRFISKHLLLIPAREPETNAGGSSYSFQEYRGATHSDLAVFMGSTPSFWKTSFKPRIEDHGAFCGRMCRKICHWK